MAKIGGTQVNVGLGIESTPGTAVAATHYPQWQELTMQAVSEKALFTSQRGIRNQASNSMIRRRYSQGSLAVVPNADTSPLLWYLALGSKATAGPTDGTYTHTFTVQNANASMKTATMLIEQGGEVTERYANCVVNSLNLEVADGYAKLVAELLGGFPDTSTLTESFTQETEFAYHQYTAKFGTSLSNAASQNATPLKDFKLNINNNVQLDEAFLSGANTPVAGGFLAGRLQISGSYTLHFDGTTELDKYKANTKNALIITFTGAITGGGSTTEKIIIKLGRLVLNNPPKEFALDGIVILTQEFECEYDATDKEIQVEVTNDTSSYA